jgi:hypothetical protein
LNRAHRWNRFWFTPERPINLAICRLLFFALMCGFYFTAAIAPLSEVNESSAFWEPVWLMRGIGRLFHGAHLSLIPSAPWMLALGLIWKLSLVTACIGLFTRASTGVAFLLGIYFIALFNNYGKAESDQLPMVFILGILALSRCGDAISVDALLRRRRGGGPVAPSGEYRWPVRVVWVLMALMFFNAGTAKLRHSGLHWAWDEGFSLLLITRFYDPNPPALRIGLFIANHLWLARLMGFGSLFVETCFPLALFTKWGRRFFPPAAFAMQLGIGVIMNIWFIHFLCAYLFWVPWDRIALRLGARFAEEPERRTKLA